MSDSGPYVERACGVAHPDDDGSGLDTWSLRFVGYSPADEGRREALCTLANGYWGVRGAGEESSADGVHYPGTYFAGVYDVVDTSVDGVPVRDEEMVNAPNWLALRLRLGGGDWFALEAPGGTQVVDFRQDLDIRHGVLTRSATVRDDRARVTSIRSDRFVSQASPRTAGLRVTVVPVDWSGPITVRTGIDGQVANANAAEHSIHPRRHLRPTLTRELADDTLLLEAETEASRIRIAMAARTIVRVNGAEVRPRREVHADVSGAVWHQFTVDVVRGDTVEIEKAVCVSTSRDRAILSPARSASDSIASAAPFAALLAEHVQAWERLWLEFAVELRPGGAEARSLHFNTFHVLQTLNAVDTDLDAGVPARGLHGEGYDGHVFWDELFVYPFVTVRRPRLSSALLAYRYRRLGAARAAALRDGHAGAMFPWQSGMAGNDVTPAFLYNPLDHRWIPDHSSLQRHVGLAVAFSAWQYFESTGDTQFLLHEGADLIVEVARFFASLAEYDAARDRYSIAGVMGPDEFHDGYVGHVGEGVRDNVYTNVMTAWVLRHAIATVEVLRGHPGGLAWKRLGVKSAELESWARIAGRLTVVFNRDGTLSQFEGYDDLEHLDLDHYRRTYPWIGRLDLILAAAGDTTDRYQVSKQPDTLMLLYLLSAEELRELLAGMGYDFPPDVVTRTIDRYSATCTFGSTLSNVVLAWVEARRDRARSYRFLEEATSSDLDDIQHGTSREGVHIGAMAGSIDIVTRCYLGLEMRDGRLRFHPLLPDEIELIRFHLVYRDHALSVTVSQRVLEIASEAGTAAPIRIVVDGAEAALATGERRVFTLLRRPG